MRDVSLLMALVFGTLCAEGAVCEPMLAGIKASNIVRHYVVDGADVETIRVVAEIKLRSPWTAIDKTGVVKTLKPGHDYIAFRDGNMISVVDLGKAKALNWIDFEVGKRKAFSSDRIGNCWPRISDSQSVLFMSNEDAGQIFYHSGHWRVMQCDD